MNHNTARKIHNATLAIAAVMIAVSVCGTAWALMVVGG